MNDYKRLLKSLQSALGGSITDVEAIKAIVFAGTLSLFVKVLSLCKESVIAYFFGISPQVDIYVLAMVFVTFFVGPVGGALATLLTQKYIEIRNTVSFEAAANLFFQCQIFGLFCMLVIVAMQAGVLRAPPFQDWVGNGFAELEIIYLAVLFPITFLSLMSIINSSLLTARERFKAYVLLPAMVPVSIIFGLVICPEEYIFIGLLLGTLIGYTVEFLLSSLQLRGISLGITWDSIWRQNAAFRRIAKSMGPMFVSGVIMGSCLIVDQIMAILAGEGAVAVINYGNKVALGLISVISIFWTVLYPIFVKMVTERDFQALRGLLWRFSLVGIICLVPLCGLIAYFSEALVALIFQHGAFKANDSIIVAKVQSVYLLHIPIYILCMICMRVANSLENTQTLLIGNVISLILNVVLNFIFIERYGVIGIPIATLVAYGITVLYWMSAANWLIAQAVKAQRHSVSTGC